MTIRRARLTYTEVTAVAAWFKKNKKDAADKVTMASRVSQELGFTVSPKTMERMAADSGIKLPRVPRTRKQEPKVNNPTQPALQDLMAAVQYLSEMVAAISAGGATNLRQTAAKD